MGIPYEESGCSERGDASADEVCICFVRIARKEGMMIGGGVEIRHGGGTVDGRDFDSGGTGRFCIEPRTDLRLIL